MNQFLKKEEVSLINGGYLTGKEGVPIYNQEFVQAQRRAEWVVTFAEMAKGKDFVGKKADSLADVKAAVCKALATKDEQYLAAPKEVQKKLTKQLADEAMDFIAYQKDSTKVEKTNKFLQEFNVLNDFEKFGLFFGEGIVKLNKLYTVKEIVAAVKEVIDLVE